LRAALLQLLSIKDTSYGESGLYTALAQADLSLDEVSIENGEAVIKLSGDLSLGGVCDNPRVQAQLVETALQFPTVNKVSIFLNDEPLEEALSMQ
jgi:spore germination protein GerM